jgi:hypothetical protein
VAPAYRIAIDVSRLRVTSAGVALLDANWEVLARDRMKRPILGRARISIAGRTATDGEIVRLETILFERLAEAVDIPDARASDGDRPGPICARPTRIPRRNS